MSVVEPISTLTARLRPHFGSSARDGGTVVRFPGARIPLRLEVSPPDLICVSGEVARTLDWSAGLSDCLLRRNAGLGLATLVRRAEGVLVEARLPASADDEAIAEAARVVAQVAAETCQLLDRMGILQSVHDLRAVPHQHRRTLAPTGLISCVNNISRILTSRGGSASTTVTPLQLRPTAALAETKDIVDLAGVRRKLMDAEEEEGLFRDTVDLMEAEYRKFLALHLAHPGTDIVPSASSTRSGTSTSSTPAHTPTTARRCSGSSSLPYFGMNGPGDSALHDAYATTTARYRAAFGKPPASALDLGGRRALQTDSLQATEVPLT